MLYKRVYDNDRHVHAHCLYNAKIRALQALNHESNANAA